MLLLLYLYAIAPLRLCSVLKLIFTLMILTKESPGNFTIYPLSKILVLFKRRCNFDYNKLQRLSLNKSEVAVFKSHLK